MKLTLIAILTLGLFACNNSADKKSVDNEIVKDSLVHVENSSIDKNEIATDNYNCDFDKFINDPKTPKLAKDIYLDNEWNLNNDNEALALLDSLTAKDKSSRQFYFKVVTKSEKKSDGYFSEGLGNIGYEYVLNNTQEFASYFDNTQCHTDNDLATWADILILEFGIVGEGEYDKPIVENYIAKLKSNCKDCSSTQKETINKFGLTLNDKWKEFLKNID
jgi:hypothetical protein